MKIKPLLVALPLTLCLAACKSTPAPAPASPTQLTSTEKIYVHAPSGMSFPEAVGAFQREKIVQYDHTGDDISVGYNLISVAATVAATVYVYPAPPLTSVGSAADVIASAREHLCQSEFERRKKELTDAHPGARKVRENPNSLSPVGIPVPGKMAAYEFDGVFQGQSQPLASELYVFCYVGDKWAIEYRFSAPVHAAFTDPIANFMRSLPWIIAGPRAIAMPSAEHG